MSRVLLAEEFGAGPNGALMLALLADELAGAGHETALALRDFTRDFRMDRSDVPWQAPLWRGPLHMRIGQIGRHPAKIGGVEDVIATNGMGDARVLHAMVASWRKLLDAIGPDHVVGYAAPGLALACEIAGLPFAMVGDMHVIPPDADGRLPRHDVLQPPVARAGDVIATVNALRTRHGLEALAGLPDLFATGDVLVFGHPALDPFVARRPQPLLGPLDVPAGLAPEDAEEAVAILSLGHKDIEDVAFGLMASRQRCGVHVLDASPAMNYYLEQAGALLSLREALDRVATARVVVHHGEPEIAVKAALAGVPQLLLPPGRFETRAMAERLGALGCGKTVGLSHHPIQAMERALTQAGGDGEFQAVARARAQELATGGPFPGKRAIRDVVGAV